MYRFNLQNGIQQMHQFDDIIEFLFDNIITVMYFSYSQSLIHYFIEFEIIMIFFIYYWHNNNTFENFDLQYYIELEMINDNPTCTVSDNINNDSNNNNNANYNKTKCGINNVCKVKPNAHNVDHVQLVQLMTKLLVLIIVNVILIGIFVHIKFKISISTAASLAVELFASASFELESFQLESFELILFESVLFRFLLSNIYLWIIFSLISRYCILIT